VVFWRATRRSFDKMDEQVIPILHVANAAQAAAWYKRIGFEQEWEHRFKPDLPAFVCVARGTVRIFLSEHEGDARPDTLLYVWVRDVFAIAKDFQVKVSQQPWAQEIELRDPDGNRLRIGTATA
jgi:glyoxalase superfamily protein